MGLDLANERKQTQSGGLESACPAGLPALAIGSTCPGQSTGPRRLRDPWRIWDPAGLRAKPSCPAEAQARNKHLSGLLHGVTGAVSDWYY